MKEHDIRPADLLARYLELSARDADICFDRTDRYDIPCVACGGGNSEVQFEKNGFPYSSCKACGTLFQSPRPPISAFEAFYRNSESSRYWADTFFPAVAEVRREKIFRPRMERLASLCADVGISVDRLIDVGAGYGIFLDEWRRKFPNAELVAIEPSESLAQECRTKGFHVVEEMVENVDGYDDHADLVACFEVLEHVYDPLSFVKVLARLTRPGGYVFVTTLGVDGFDIQTLWERSNSIFPPHHINFLSVDGFERLFNRAGLEEVRVLTPGQLDVDIVRNAFEKDPSVLEHSRFLQSVLSNPSRSAAFQQFLAENKMSSHTWVMARKPADWSPA